MEYANLLEEALEAWTGVREGLIDEVQHIPADKYDFRPAKEVRSVGELGVHLLESGALMVGELTREKTDFKRLPYPQLLAEHAGKLSHLTAKEPILSALREQGREGVKTFLAVGELHMLQLIERFDGKLGTRLAWLQHGIEHESYHKGQVALYERLLGLEPRLTAMIRASS